MQPPAFVPHTYLLGMMGEKKKTPTIQTHIVRPLQIHVLQTGPQGLYGNPSVVCVALYSHSLQKSFKTFLSFCQHIAHHFSLSVGDFTAGKVEFII